MTQRSKPSILTIKGDLETLDRARSVLNEAGITGLSIEPESTSAISCEHGHMYHEDLFATSRDGILFMGLSGRIQDANPALLSMLGYDHDDFCNMFYQQITPEKWRRIDASVVIPTLLERGEYGEYEKELITFDGTTLPVAVRCWLVRDAAGEPVQTLAVIRDVSMRKSLEDQLRQAQKMEALGTLAGGIAHDFNNVLAAILGYIELARFDVDESNPARKSIDQIYKASQRARSLVGRILSFSRPSDHRKAPVFMQQVINESLEMLRATLPSTIEIRQFMTSHLFAIDADATQVHQILMNLCTNASHAMADGGTLSIELEVAWYTELEVHGFHDVEPGKYMRLTVMDTGCGMDDEVKKRMFDPYYSTKQRGQGSGMGLSVVHGIIKAHSGFIEVKTAPGDGTTFHLYFPVPDKQDVCDSTASDAIGSGHERVLFVDDETDLAEVGAAMLQRLGYRVTSFSDSQKALDVFAHSPGDFDIVISDLTMPKISGVGFVREIRALREDIPVIVCTGYSDSLSADEVSAAGIDFLLMKPLEIRELAASIRNALALRRGEDEITNSLKAT